MYTIRLFHFHSKQMFCVLCYSYPHSGTKWYKHTYTKTEQDEDVRIILPLPVQDGLAVSKVISLFQEKATVKGINSVCAKLENVICLYLLHRWFTQIGLLSEDLEHVLANVSLVLVSLNKSLILNQL